MKEVIHFLELIETNNNRDWFNANRPLYDNAREQFELTVTKIIAGISTFDISIGQLLAKDCTFRIYRDVRFSKDKMPYKTHMGAYMEAGGRKGGKSGYYMHIEPGKSFIGGGIYMPEPEKLKKVRQEIHYNADEFKKIINHPDFKKAFEKLSEEDMLKRPPKDFPPDFADISLLKYKSYVVGRTLNDTEVSSDSLASTAIEIFKTMKPFIGFLNRAIDH